MALRHFDRRDFPPERLADAKRGRCVSACLPAKDEQDTVGPIVERILGLAVVDEVVVVDDSSADATAAVASAAGARVVAAVGAGKGDALWQAVTEAKGEVLVFGDADVRAFDPSFVTGLLGPLLTDDTIGFVKGTYARPGDGGRVTELVARPLLSVLFPGLTGFTQPLAGEFAATRAVLERLPFVSGYGVDLALLVDAVALLGLDAMAQVDLGARVHRNRPLAELRPQAEAVLRAALHRAGLGGPVAQRPPPR